MDTAVVLGGSGFLGSHVADELSHQGYRVKIFDCKVSPYLRKDQEMIVGDICSISDLISAIQGSRYVFNFAGLADLEAAQHQPIEAVQLNVLGNVNALEAAKKSSVERFVFASSVYVYSRVGSFYRASKQAAENFVEAYHERYGLPYTILRYGSLYGRRSDIRNGVYRFLKQVLEKKSIVYNGSGEAMREYIHVSDAARLTVQILDKQYMNRHIVLTGHEKISVRHFLKMIAEMMPDKIELEFNDSQKNYGHYEMTPYYFHPKVGHKLVPNDYVDLGQGLLDCLAEQLEQSHKAMQDITLEDG